jgi:hypothetical protein
MVSRVSKEILMTDRREYRKYRTPVYWTIRSSIKMATAQVRVPYDLYLHRMEHLDHSQSPGKRAAIPLLMPMQWPAARV